MKVSYAKVQNENQYVMLSVVFKFRIQESILKSHYKALARLSMLFNSSERNVGFIRKESEQEFLALIEKIEASNAKRCATSHAKTAVARRSSRKCEHSDLGSLGYRHGETVTCPHCGKKAVGW